MSYENFVAFLLPSTFEKESVTFGPPADQIDKTGFMRLDDGQLLYYAEFTSHDHKQEYLARLAGDVFNNWTQYLIDSSQLVNWVNVS